MARTFEDDVLFLQEYKQFTVLNKGKDTSPEAFLVWQGQQFAYKKLEQVVQWYAKWEEKYGMDEAFDELGAILN